ncbi:hypothetical protein SSX86_033106 [Deinandra increscens subsp. villosa]|uniref:CCHC-type domain-containing protein n=1 Tax=Deinandra increscens subsp. villosa TaxID=3103831 RepID=A0AAP0C6I8_9ASTR
MADGGSGGALVTTGNQSNNISLQCPKLTTTNYTSWSIMVETILRAYGLWGAIDPVTGAAVDDKKNYQTKAIIFQSLPEDVLLQVAKHKNAKDVWEAIRVRYLGADRVQKARLQTLRSELEMLRMKENETVDEFAGKISGIEAKFKNLGSTLEEVVLVRKLLNSVPKKYLQIVASIEQYSDIETMLFEEAVGRLKAFEERVRMQDANDDEGQGKLLLSRDDGPEKSRYGDTNRDQFGRGRGGDNRGRGQGYGRGRGGRFQTNDRKEQGMNRDKRHIKCYNCQEYGHYAYECPKQDPKEEMANLTVEDDEPALL